MDAKIDFIVDLGWFGTKVSKNVGVQIFGPLDPLRGPLSISGPLGLNPRLSPQVYWMDFNDLKVILGVFHDAESIYDTFKAITGSFNSLPVENTFFFLKSFPDIV